MLAKLVAFSIVTVVPPPFKTTYAVGIAEDEKGDRIPVRIESRYFDALKIGLEGEVRRELTDFGELNFFFPKVKEKPVRKVALITGASRGIGKATALEFARRGYNIAINDIELPDEGKDAMSAIKKMGRTAIFVKADVSKFEEVGKMVQRVMEEFGRIDVLVNNAGMNIDKLLINMTPEMWQRVLDVDLTGVFNCTKAVIPHMIEQGGGRIINVSSMSALDGRIGQANYVAAKGGIIAFTKTIAREHAQYNILCNAIAPGHIKTRMTDALPLGTLREFVSEVPLGRRGSPQEVAKVIAFLASDEASYITGQVININAGAYL